MKRAVFHGEGRITVEDAPVPTVGPGELLVRVEACALCGSDRGAWEKGGAATPGHEIAGTVDGAGPGTTTPIGSRGAVFLVVYCGACALCLVGSRGACVRKAGMIGFDRDGGYAEYVAVPERCFLPLDPALSWEDGVVLLDVTGTPMHALRRSGVLDAPPPSALVMGAGPVGMGAIVALRAVGVPRVLAVDLSPFRLAFAKRLGAEPIVGGDVAAEAVRERLPDGPPLVIEASDSPSGQRQALDLLAPGGTLVLVGHSRKPLEVWGSRDLIAQERTILGSEYFDDREFADNQRLILEGRLTPSRVITHRLPLDRIQEAYELFWSGETGKVLIYPHGANVR